MGLAAIIHLLVTSAAWYLYSGENKVQLCL